MPHKPPTSPVNEIRWEDPPSSVSGNGRRDWRPVADELRAHPGACWRPVADELRAHPGAWAIVDTALADSRASRPLNSCAAAIKSGRLEAFRPVGSFECKVRTVDNEVRLYARYVTS